MAIKIIDMGAIPSQREWTGTCSKCRTKVEYLQEDAISSGHCQHDGEWSEILCPLPLCGNRIHGSIKPRVPQPPPRKP